MSTGRRVRRRGSIRVEGRDRPILVVQANGRTWYCVGHEWSSPTMPVLRVVERGNEVRYVLR